MANPAPDALAYVGLFSSIASIPVVWRFVARRLRERGYGRIMSHLCAVSSAFFACVAIFVVMLVRDAAALLVATIIAGVIYAGTRPKKEQPVQPLESVPSPPQPIHDDEETAALRQRSLAAMHEAGKARKKDMQRRGEHEGRPLAGWSAVPQALTGSLCEIEFDYENAGGEESHRTVDVHAVDNAYFEGFCHKAMGTRTFAISRIIGKVIVHDTGEVLPARKWAAQARADARNPGVVDIGRDDRQASVESHEASATGVEILFTGFTRSQRQELEEMAEAAGMIVRKSVTKGLSYLCTGPNAGPAKLAQAAESGASIIDHDEFVDLLNG